VDEAGGIIARQVLLDEAGVDGERIVRDADTPAGACADRAQIIGGLERTQ